MVLQVEYEFEMAQMIQATISYKSVETLIILANIVANPN